MNLREKLEKIKEIGWTIDDLIEVAGAIDGFGQINQQDKEFLTSLDVVKEIKKHNVNTYIYEMISKYVISLEITPNLMGYHYMIEAVQLCLNNRKFLNAITTEVYPAIAKKYDVVPSRVERGIYHSIEKSWKLMPDKRKLMLLGTCRKRQPTNSVYISLICERIACKLAKIQMGKN